MTVTVEFAPSARPVSRPASRAVSRPVARPAGHPGHPGHPGTGAAGVIGSVEARPLHPAPRPATAVTRRPVRRVRTVAAGASCAAVAPQPIAASSAVQLTRRGWTVLLGTAVAVAAVLVWLAYLSHPATTTGSAGGAASSVVVQQGDTLWSIASRVAPDRDPRAVVFDLQQANGLGDSTVVAGQVLQLH
ncbi:LysM peptidoglycan-binding domain-containing protein [Jatrophihabitans sp. YIM 134969]